MFLHSHDKVTEGLLLKMYKLRYNKDFTGECIFCQWNIESHEEVCTKEKSDV